MPVDPIADFIRSGAFTLVPYEAVCSYQWWAFIHGALTVLLPTVVALAVLMRDVPTRDDWPDHGN